MIPSPLASKGAQFFIHRWRALPDEDIQWMMAYVRDRPELGVTEAGHALADEFALRRARYNAWLGTGAHPQPYP